jgi:riboflavin synthase
MFTGIVQDLVSVREIVDEGDLVRLVLDMDATANELQLGASVAVNGTCLTVTRVVRGRVHFDVITESLRTTNLGRLEVGDLVNVERSYHVGDEIGGHILSGHVTATSPLSGRFVQGHDHVLRFNLEPKWLKYVFHKGFIGLDGASITVSSLDRADNWFEVSLIPETLSRTTLGQIEAGGLVNVEVDGQTVTTVETVERIMSERQVASNS